MVYRSLKDWNRKGKMVKKGERATARSSDGVALFSSSQVKKFPEPSRTVVRSSYRRPEYRGGYSDGYHDHYDDPYDDPFGGSMIGLCWGSD